MKTESLSRDINPDYPIEDITQDKFQRGNFSKGIARIITSNSSEKSTVLGIYGEWGSGKTSVLKLISSELSKNNDVIQIFFNPWRFHDEKELLLSFFFTMADSLDKSIKTKTEKVGDLIKDYSGFLKPLSWFVPDISNPENVDWLGNKLEYIPIPFIQKFGTGLTLLSDGIDSGLDYKNLDSKTATFNTLTRLGNQGFGYGYGKLVEKNSLGKPMDYLNEQAMKQLTGAVEDQVIKNNTESSKEK
jgi:hypothetical protein